MRWLRNIIERMRTQRRSLWFFSDCAAIFLLWLGAALSLLTLGAFLGAGIFSFYRAALAFHWCLGLLGHCAADSDAESLTMAINGLELLLLAPLAYLLLVSLAYYIERYRKPADAVSNPGEISADALLSRTKALAVSLLISTVSVDLVGRLLGKDPAHNLTWSLSGIEFLMIFLFTVYYIILQRHAGESARGEHHSSIPQEAERRHPPDAPQT